MSSSFALPFLLFTESRVQFDQFHQPLGGEGRHEDDLSAQRRRELTRRVEEGHRAKEGHLWFVVLTGKD